MSRGLILVCCLMLSPSPGITADEPLDLPYRHSALTIDADLDDWHDQAFQIKLWDPLMLPPYRNVAAVRLAWDADFLWFAVEMLDDDVVTAPPDITGTTLYQWDAFELYMDVDADGSARMGADDFQFIIACDGRSAVLQGEPLYERWDVPKRVRPGLVFDAAARQEPWGYVLEGAVPFNAVGLSDPEAGRILGLDLCFGDWLEDHPRLAELAINLDNLHDISLAEEDSLAIVDPDSTGWDGMLAWEERAYRPWSWSGQRDFGYPARWKRIRLAGGPRLSESLVMKWGPWTIVLAVAALAVGLTLTGALLLRRQYRRRMALLLEKLAALEVRKDDGSDDDGASPGDPPTAPPPAPDIVQKSLSYIQDHLRDNFNVTQLAEGVGVSTRTLQRSLRESLDCSPREAILASKMRVAKQLLETGQWRVSEVSDHLGYESPYHFSRLFKTFYQQTPSSVIPPPTRH